MNKKSIHLRIPGSTANLGAGFDTLALSLGVYAEFSFHLNDHIDDSKPLISLPDALINKLPQDKSNLVYQALSHFWRDDPSYLDQICISIDTTIPLGSGLGSSSTAIIAGAWAAQVLANKTPQKDLILNQVAALEGHADNAAASLYGGLVTVTNTENGIKAQTLEWPKDWSTLVLVPGYSLSTEVARAALPKQVPLSDCIFNLQHLGLFLSSILKHDEDTLKESLDDKIHQPYRQPLIPEFLEIKQLCRKLPAIGCVLSGAGPSMLIITNQKNKTAVIEQLALWAKNNRALLLDLPVDASGIQAKTM